MEGNWVWLYIHITEKYVTAVVVFGYHGINGGKCITKSVVFIS